MPEPAARIGDATAHGGVITKGCETVIIGGAKAARLGDMHTCPMVSPTPHVGGPIVSASNTVIIGGMPAARFGDSATCTGPKDTIVLGCSTVLIGSSGGASGATGSAEGGESSPPAPEKFSLKVQTRGQPMEGVQCRLFIDGEEHTVSTDSEGLIEQEVSSSAGIGFLIISGGEDEDDIHIPMLVGTQKPLKEAETEDDIHAEAAARQRLIQLGFFEPNAPYHYEVALKDYQLSVGIEPSKHIDKSTADALKGTGE